jgi:hypothetical protein
MRVDDNLRFERLEDGSVKVVTPNFEQVIAPNIWGSVVLCMTKFSERCGDWQAFMAHHQGEKDMLVGQRGGY